MDADSRTARLALVPILLVLLASVARAQPPGMPAAGQIAGSPVNATVAVNGSMLESRPFVDASFGEIELRDLPSSRSIWSLVETADPLTIVDRIDNGGLYLGEPVLFGSFGSSGTQATLTFDGLDITDPERTGTPLGYPDPSTLRALQVVASLPGVEVGGGGPVMALVPRAPATRFGGSLGGSYVPNQWQAKPKADAPAPPIARFGSAGEGTLLLSGPVSATSGLLFSARRAQTRRFERDDPTPLDGRVTSLFLHSVTTRGNGSRVRAVGSVDSVSHPFSGRLRFADRSVSARDDFVHAHTVWEHATSGGGTWSVGAGYERAVFGSPEGATSSTTGVMERLRDGPIADAALASSGVRRRWQGVLRTSPVAGRHALDLGASFRRIASELDSAPRALIGELVDGLPARVWDYSYGAEGMLRHSTEYAAWADDRIALGRRVTLEGGVRFESTHADARDNPTAITWRTVLPRGHLRIGLTGSGSASFFTGYGVRRHRLPLGYLAFGDAAAPVAEVHRWNDANLDHVVQASEIGTLVAMAGPGSRPGYATSLDQGLLAPLTDDFIAGFDFRLGRRWRARLAGVVRHERRLVASVNEGVTVDDYTVRLLPDRGNDYFNAADDRLLAVYDRKPASFGKDRMFLTNPPGDDGNHIGGELAIERPFDGRWYMLFGFSAQRSDAYAGNPGYLPTENDQGVIGQLFEDPNAASYARGRLFFERGYIIKWSGGFATSRGWHFGAIARYQDGQHFARMVVVPGLNQGPELVQAYTRGHSRFTFSFTLDARLEKRFRTGPSSGVAFVAEAFNLLNNDIEVEEDPVVTRTFRATTALQPPRVVRLGLRLDF